MSLTNGNAILFLNLEFDNCMYNVLENGGAHSKANYDTDSGSVAA